MELSAGPVEMSARHVHDRSISQFMPEDFAWHHDFAQIQAHSPMDARRLYGYIDRYWNHYGTSSER
jgi:hypothetical protein